MRNFVSHNLHSIILNLDTQYNPIGFRGVGQQGCIIEANGIDRRVAIKKLLIYDADCAKRVYREFVISKSIHHQNLIKLLDAFSPPDLNEVYLVYELMDYSMRNLLSLPQTDPRNLKNLVFDQNNGDYLIADILFQLFCGLRYLHQDKLKFIHRDIKPANILMREVEARWLVKICDLGLARHLTENESQVTKYVVTWPYRAPEVLLRNNYGSPIDIWSVGCILGEILTGNLLFERTNRNDQIFLILCLVGFPNGTILPSHIQNEIKDHNYGPCRIGEYFTDDKLPNWTHQRLTKKFIRELLIKLLKFDPSQRLTAQQGVELPEFGFLRYRTGMTDIAPAPYTPMENFSQTPEQWMSLIREQLQSYE